MVKGSYFWEAVSEVGSSSNPKERALKGLALFLFSSMVFGFAIGGVWCLKSAFNDSLKNRAALTWSKASGRVTEARVEEVSNGSGRAVAMYRPSVTVRYEAGGKWYSCHSIYAGYGSTSDSCKVYADVAGFTPGNKSVVFYNPTNPSESMLRPGKHGINGLFMGLGAVFILLSLVLGIPLLFSKRKAETVQPLKW